jgi:hypothetical protein
MNHSEYHCYNRLFLEGGEASIKAIIAGFRKENCFANILGDEPSTLESSIVRCTRLYGTPEDISPESVDHDIDGQYRVWTLFKTHAFAPVLFQQRLSQKYRVQSTLHFTVGWLDYGGTSRFNNKGEPLSYKRLNYLEAIEKVKPDMFFLNKCA